MLKQRVFILVSHLMSSRWARDHEVHHGSCENAYAARLGFLHLEINYCFVLDHEDASINIRIPAPFQHAQSWQWGKLHLGYVACQGEDELRQPGFYAHWQNPLKTVVHDDISF